MAIEEERWRTVSSQILEVAHEPLKRERLIEPENAAERVQRSCGNRGGTESVKPIEQIIEELNAPALTTGEPNKMLEEMVLMIQSLEERVLALERDKRLEYQTYELEY